VPGSGFFVGDPVDGAIEYKVWDRTVTQNIQVNSAVGAETPNAASLAQARRIAYDLVQVNGVLTASAVVRDDSTANLLGTGVSRLPVDAIDATAAGILTDLAVGDIIYCAPTQNGNAELGDEKVAAALTEAMLIVDIVRTAATTADLYVERGVLGTTIGDIANDSPIYKRNSAGAFPGVPSASVTSPAKLHRDASGVHTAHNQVRGNIQTTGVRMPRGGPRRTHWMPPAQPCKTSPQDLLPEVLEPPRLLLGSLVRWLLPTSMPREPSSTRPSTFPTTTTALMATSASTLSSALSCAPP